MKVYTLSKISDPGFELTTTHLDIVYDILSLYVCDMCINEVKDYGILSKEEKINHMIGTACGCEFILEEEENNENLD